MTKRNQQTDLFEAKTPDAKRPDRFGGDQRKNRASRRARPVSTRMTMHLMMKSLKAKGPWSFLRPANQKIVRDLLTKHSEKNGIRILWHANVGNHLHIHLKAKTRASFKAFLRAFSGAVAIKITGANKLNKLKERFWTQTPYTRFIHGLADFLRLKEYFEINQIEGFGARRHQAESFIGQVARVRQRFRGALGRA